MLLKSIHDPIVERPIGNRVDVATVGMAVTIGLTLLAHDLQQYTLNGMLPIYEALEQVTPLLM